MCGIFGFSSNSVKLKTLEEGLGAIAHRGPDNSACEVIGDTYLGHARLSIIDISEASNQPLWDSNRRACIVFNGEIYNYKELREELSSLGVEFRSHGDAEVILNLYLYGGDDWLNRLNGIFAFSIYDLQLEQLFIARDAFGVKPLYYAENSEGFFFSSEIKALLKVPSIDRSLSYDAIFRSIVFLWSPGPSTILKEVYKLEPGSFLKVRNKKIVEHGKFWSWPTYSPIRQSKSEACQNVLGSLVNSVRQQLVSDVPIGSFLSGGLDSSLIVAIAKKSGVKNLQCFTIDAFSGGESEGFSSDLPYAKKLAEELGVDLHVVKANPDIMKMLPEMLYHLDEPQADPASLNVFMICELARQKGIKVLLSGSGGDDVFTGYRRHYAVTLEKYWSGLPAVLRGGLQELSRCLPKNNPSLRRISKAFAYASLDENERILSYFYWIDPEIVRGLFADDICEMLDSNPMQSMISELDALPSLNPLEKMLYLERKYFLVDHNFNYTDKMSMAHGVEVRVPFLDYRVVDEASKVHSSYKQNGRIGKWVLKKASESYLPKSVIYRKKTGFGAPLRSWLNNELKDMVDDLLSADSLRQRGIFKYSAVRHLIEQDRAGREDYTYPIFSLLCIEMWCRVFLDGKHEEASS